MQGDGVVPIIVRMVLRWIGHRIDLVRIVGLTAGGAIALVGTIFTIYYWSEGASRDALVMAKIAGVGWAAFALGLVAQWSGRFFDV